MSLYEPLQGAHGDSQVPLYLAKGFVVLDFKGVAFRVEHWQWTMLSLGKRSKRKDRQNGCMLTVIIEGVVVRVIKKKVKILHYLGIEVGRRLIVKLGAPIIDVLDACDSSAGVEVRLHGTKESPAEITPIRIACYAIAIEDALLDFRAAVEILDRQKDTKVLLVKDLTWADKLMALCSTRLPVVPAPPPGLEACGRGVYDVGAALGNLEAQLSVLIAPPQSTVESDVGASKTGQVRETVPGSIEELFRIACEKRKGLEQRVRDEILLGTLD